jgi:thymidylate synthase|tara:strand:- start:181 stop:834 length:654 start_codon:yes stop_codon:yes gene_type:complete
MNIADIRKHFIQELLNDNYTTDRNGGKTIELLGASFIANEDAIFGTPNRDYIETELEWYESESTNVNDIYDDYREAPAAWLMTANAHGEINSNYGHLIYGDKYHNQFDQVVMELSNNPDSRRASMIYTRPSIWIEYNENGKNDFICTNSVTYYIRDNALHCVVQMRSNDVIFGYRNDWAWQDYVLRHLANELSYDVGDIHWQVQNLHVYERHFGMVK